MHLQIISWKKKSLGIFDFGRNNHLKTERNYYITEDCSMVLDSEKDAISFVKGNIPEHSEEAFKAIKLDLENKKITYNTQVTEPNIANMLWKYLIPPAEYIIKQGDKFRLGKQVFRIKYIYNEKVYENSDMNGRKCMRGDDLYFTREDKVEIKALDIEGECRICLEGSNPDNAFINLCECSHSMPVHLNCVKKWLDKKNKAQQSEYCSVYDINKVKCDICGIKYPLKVTFMGKTVNLFNPDFDTRKLHAYVEIFEKNTNKLRSVAIVNLESSKKTFGIGRSEKNDIVIDDNSISRNHAELSFSNRKIKLKDLGSKYGTHMLIEEAALPSFVYSLHLQIDRFYIKVHNYRNKKCFCYVKHQHSIITNPFTNVEFFIRLKKLSVAETATNNYNKKQKGVQMENDVVGSGIPVLNDRLQHESEQEILRVADEMVNHEAIQNINRFNQFDNEELIRLDTNFDTPVTRHNDNEPRIKNNAGNTNYAKRIIETKRENKNEMPKANSEINELLNELQNNHAGNVFNVSSRRYNTSNRKRSGGEGYSIDHNPYSNRNNANERLSTGNSVCRIRDPGIIGSSMNNISKRFLEAEAMGRASIFINSDLDLAFDEGELSYQFY